jgi:alpha-N-arabinofuranosidase
MKLTTRILLLTALLAAAGLAREFHVATTGYDGNDGSAAAPLQTISAAAKLAQPGDVITVQEGTYRERINPPRGGASDASRSRPPRFVSLYVFCF